MSDTEFNDQKAISAMRAIYDRIRPEVAAHYRAAFDRWLTEHDRQVAEKAWERAEFAFERAHNADMLEPWGYMPDNPYRGTPEQEGKGDE